MSKKDLHYVWTYFTKGTNKTCAMCKICDKTFQLQKTKRSVLKHIQQKHNSDDNTVTSKVSNSQKKISIKEDKKRLYSITEDNRLKCDICKKSYNMYYYISKSMKYHLKTIHQIDKKTAQKHLKLCHKHAKRNSRKNTMTCNYCKNVFQNNNYFTIMMHLINVHEIDISLEIRSVELNDESSLPNIEVNDIVTSSCFSNTEVNNTDTLSSPFDIAVNDIVTSSCLSNTEGNDSDTLSNVFDTEVNDTDTLSNIFDTEVNDIDTSSTYQQPHTTYIFESNPFDTKINDIVTSNFLSNTEVNNIDTSSTYEQPHTTYIFESNPFDTEVNDIVTSSCLSNTEVNDTDTLSNVFDTEVNDIVTSNFLSNTEVNDIDTSKHTSSFYQQPHATYTFEYNLNNSSKSNRNAENIATFSSYQQPIFNSDDSFNYDDHDNIDNFDSLAEECLKELKKIKRFQ